MSLFRKIYNWLDVRIGVGEIAEKEFTGRGKVQVEKFSY